MKTFLIAIVTLMSGFGAAFCFLFDMPLIAMVLGVTFFVLLPCVMRLIDKQDREDRRNFNIRRGYYGEKIHNYSNTGGWKGI